MNIQHFNCTKWVALLIGYIFYGQSQFQTLELSTDPVGETASRHLGIGVCLMPKLRKVKLPGMLHDEFFTELSKNATRTQVLVITCFSFVFMFSSQVMLNHWCHSILYSVL